MVFQFLRATGVEFVGGRPVELGVLAFKIKRVPGFGVRGEEPFGPFGRDEELSDLGDDDGPTEQRQQEKGADGDFTFEGGFLESELKGAGGEDGMDHGRMTVTRPTVRVRRGLADLVSFWGSSSSALDAVVAALSGSSDCVPWVAVLAAVP